MAVLATRTLWEARHWVVDQLGCTLAEWLRRSCAAKWGEWW